jgi:hypothetical protein
MAWCDKLAIGLVGIVMTLFVLASFLNGGLQHLGPSWFGAFFDIAWRVVLIIGLPSWVLLRIVDFVTGGPNRRRGVFTVRPMD